MDHQYNIIEVKLTRKYRSYDPFITAQNAKLVYYTSYPLRRDKADWWVVIKSKPVGRIEIENVLDVAYQNDVAIVQQEVDVELETTLQHPQHILEEVSDDDILNVEEEISDNEEMNHLMTKNGTIMKMKQLRRKNGRMMELKQARRNSPLPARRYEDLPLQAIHRARPLSVGTPSPIGTSLQLSAMRLGDSSSEQLDAMAGTLLLTQRFMHPDVPPSSTATPSATPHDTISALAPGQKYRLGRVMIESNGS
ncbi:hypothetical protein RDI58_010928 [Solanum bulbocastanum]|uniref:DUF4216 domain-containing protein n=1 Tax=Solanum bulbocastanum TaxID=147425 RepID=A0AAN8YGT8_SOLBU